MLERRNAVFLKNAAKTLEKVIREERRAEEIGGISDLYTPCVSQAY